MEKAAGLTSTVVYVSYETLETYGTSNGINHYEIVMPNPDVYKRQVPESTTFLWINVPKRVS